MRTEITTTTIINVSNATELGGAVDYVCNDLILGNANTKIQLSDGTYDTSGLCLRAWVGSHNSDFNNVEICGNPANVSGVTLTAPNIVIGSVSVSTPWVFRDLTISPQGGVGILADRLSQIFLAGKIRFAGTPSIFIKGQYNSIIEALAGSELIVSAPATHFASMTTASHFLTQSQQGATPAPKITFGAGVNFNSGALLAAIDLGVCDVQSALWTGSFVGPKSYRRNGIIKHSNNIPGSGANLSDGWV